MKSIAKVVPLLVASVAFWFAGASRVFAQTANVSEAKLASATAEVASAKTTDPATILVEVDDKAITESDVSARLAEIVDMLKRRGMTAAQIERVAPDFRDRIIEDLVTRTLIENEAAKRKIIVNKDEVAAAARRFKASLPSDASFEDLLEAQGMSAETFENDLKEQLKLEKVLKIGEPTEDEIRAFYSDEENRKDYGLETPELVRARHILIAVDEEDTDEVKAAKKAKAEEVRKQLADGADFEKLAKEVSDCPSKERGGDLGKFPRGRMVKEFEDAAFSQKLNEPGPIVETEFGYHIIVVTERIEAKVAPFDEVKDKIAFLIKGRKVYEKAEDYIKDLKSKAKITYKAGARPLDEEPPPSATGVSAPAAK